MHGYKLGGMKQVVGITNDEKAFFEKDMSSPILLYGAGNSGYWIGYYMNLCGIEYEGYVDRNITKENEYLNKKPCYSTDYLKKYSGRQIRVVATAHSYESILFDLMNFDRLWNLSILCFVPKYSRRLASRDKETYDINKFLGYFRRKVFGHSMPTIISNDCTAGHIYEMMDSFMLSPTINCGMNVDDFIKCCEAPKEYLQCEPKDFFWTRDIDFGYGEYPCGLIKDVVIHFLHYNDVISCKKAWTQLSKYIDWNNMIFIMSDNGRAIPIDVQMRFDHLTSKHLTLHRGNRTMLLVDDFRNHLYMNEYYFSKRDRAIENYFDLVGWLNKVRN